MKTFFSRAFALVFLITATALHAQVPQLINYQGRVAVGSLNFTGSGSFAFALVNTNGTTSYWSNDGTSTAGSQPSAAITLTVTNGLYSVLLGDTTITNMTAVPTSVFANADVRLRVWFNDGTHGFQLLTPDQRLAPNGYFPAGSVTSATLAAGAVGSASIAPGSVGSNQIASGVAITGALNGNASTATAANSFTGALMGEVTGTQSATVVSTVGGSTAANIHSAELLANAATSGSIANSIVKRDASGNIAANTISAGEIDTGNIVFGNSVSTKGLLNLGATRFMNALLTSNLYLGPNSGNDSTVYNGGDYNTGIGARALGSIKDYSSDNTAIGANAMSGGVLGYVIDGGVQYNTAVGSGALASGVSTSETAIGYQALYYNALGSYQNTAVGLQALYSNSSGYQNTATGALALYTNTTGISNTANGYGALNSNTIGNNNSASGWKALFTNSDGYNNTATGYGALQLNVHGYENTAFGLNALQSLPSGNGNLAIGFQAGYLLTGGNNNIYVGHPGVASESGVMRIGTPGTHVLAYISGVTGTTVSGAAPVYVSGAGLLGTLQSSRRFKRDIVNMDKSSEAILSLRPVTFRYKPEFDPKGIPQWGLIAEEVNEVNPELVVRDDHGEIQTVRYEQVNAMLLNEFLKEHKRVGDLEKRLAELEAKDKAREARERERETRIARLENLLSPTPVQNALKTAAATTGN